jgi:hypothetical protein
VPELVPEEVAKAAHYKLDQEAEIATPLNFQGKRVAEISKKLHG